MQNQSSVLLVVPCISKVKATWRVFFTKKFFDRPKYDEMKVEKLCMGWQRALHVKSCACGVPAAAEPEHLSDFSYHGLWLTDHKEASCSLHDKPEV